MSLSYHGSTYRTATARSLTFFGPLPVKPAITTVSLHGGVTGTAYTSTLAATGDKPITWSVTTGTLPAGLTLDPATGVISGTPTGTAGTSSFTIRASNAAGTDDRPYTIDITAATVAPVITTASLPGVVSGATYSQPLHATGTAPITWALLTGTLPAGLSISSGGIVSGTVTSAGTATFTFTVRATNAAGTNDKQLSIIVAAAPVAPTITTLTLPPGETTTPYSETIAATGDAPITFALQGGTLPPGLSLSAGGVLSGNPTAAGSYTFTVRATNPAGTNDRQYTLGITAHVVATAPSITTVAINQLTLNSPFSQTLTATGTAPISWTALTALPPGLSLSTTGVLSGTPTLRGVTSVTIQASNSVGAVTRVYQVTVRGDVSYTGPEGPRSAMLHGEWSTWEEQDKANTIRTEMETGAVKVRRRTTGRYRLARVSVSLPADRYEYFVQWYRVSCQAGVLPTLMKTPQCHEEHWRFVEPPVYNWVSKDVFTVSCTIEQLPGWR